MGRGRLIRRASRAQRIARSCSISPHEFGNMVEIDLGGEGVGGEVSEGRATLVGCQVIVRPHTS